MKTYVVKYAKIDRRGAWREYKKAVTTDGIADHVVKEMKLSKVAARTYGDRRGLFLSATEVRPATKFPYEYERVPNGEYWYKDDGANIVKGENPAFVTYFDGGLKEFF